MPLGLQTLRDALDRTLPPGARDAVRRTAYGLRQGVLVPPADLRQRVSGSTDITAFSRVGARCASDLVQAAGRYGPPPARVLDFGAGCGRTLRWLREWWPETDFTAADIDAEALAWVAGHLPGTRTVLSDRLPPLPLADDSFDLVYAISVFTHLDVPEQDAWLAELARLVRGGGVALVTVHSRSAVRNLPAEAEKALAAAGHVYVTNDLWAGQFPDWYQTSVHAEAYVREHFSTWFDVLEVVPRGINGHQDLVVLRARP